MTKYRVFVADCEHEGDIQNVVDAIVDRGCKVEGVFWSGQDCDEAYVEFSIPDGLDKESIIEEIERIA